MNSTIKELTKKFGDGVVLSADQIIESKKAIIPWSPCIDIILGGGIPEGSWITLTGVPKCGKTTTQLDPVGGSENFQGGSENIHG